jgi:hypothetical protein
MVTMKKPKCNIREHNWQPMKRGGAHEQCTKCQDVFPCRHACEHLDCCAATNRPMPEWCGDPDNARAAMLAELAIIAPTVFAAIQKPKRAKRVKPVLQEAA